MKTQAILLLAVLVGSGCDKPAAEPEAPKVAATTTAAVEPAKSAPRLDGPTATGKALVEVDANITFHRRQGEQKGGWLHYESLAGAYLTRARLTGSIDDYVAAGDAIAEAFKRAAPGTGPFFTRAHYNYTIHQIARVEPDLVIDEKRLLRKTADMERTAGLRGDLAFHRGDLDAARASYEAALKHRRSLATVARTAFLDLKTGNLDAARKGYEEAATMAKSDRVQRAWAQLHRGIVELEAGEPATALVWYEKANESFSGWYLIEEHIAEAKLLLGDPDGAIAMYESILARTPSGEFMAALADCWEAKGDAVRQKEWTEKARAAFERDIAKLPSAASGHALEFYVTHDFKRALELAKENVKLRPNHEARMFLAQAHLANGQPDEARQALKPVVGSAWATPDFLATVAIAFAGADDAVAIPAAAAAEKLSAGAVAALRTSLALPAQ